MKAVVCTRYGPPEALRLEERSTPVPRKNEVRIRIRATAVTSSDCYVRGLNLNRAYRLMARLAMGGPRPDNRSSGWCSPAKWTRSDRSPRRSRSVIAGIRLRSDGGSGRTPQYVCWPEDGLLTTRPANLTDEEAAAIPYGGLLALSFLRKAGVGPDRRVLVFGASGAVGTSAIQLARHLGAQVTGVCSSANVDLVASLGATTVIDYTARTSLTAQSGTT